MYIYKYTSMLMILLLSGLLYTTARFAAAQPVAPVLGAQVSTMVTGAATFDQEFQSYVSYALADQPYAQAVGIGDFNHDGRADVAITAGIYTPTYLSLFLQGTNGQLEQPVRYPTNLRPEALAVGDLNGDGRDDIAVASAFDNKVSIYLQTAGGLLADKIDMATQIGPDAIVVGDVNGDGRADVVIAHWNHPSIGVLLQQAEGTLAAMTLYPVLQAGYDDIDIGDINGDDQNDIVKMNGQGLNPNLAVLHQTITHTMGSAVAYDLEGDVLSQGMAVGDVTGDGRADVVLSHRGTVAEPMSPKLSVFAQQNDGTLLLNATYATSDRLGPVEIADIDGDGRNDVIATAYNKLFFYRQTTAGILAPYQVYPLPNAIQTKPQGLDVGDINQDGRPDVVMASSQVGLVVLYHTPAAAPTATPTLIATAPPDGTPASATTPTPETTALPGSTPTATATPLPGTTPTPPPSPNQLQLLYLPVITVPKRIEPVIFTATTQCQNEAANWEYAPVTYSYGKRILATSASFRNQIGQSWRVQWKVNGQRRPDLDHTGTLTQSPEAVVVHIFYGANGQCESPIPRGVYEAEIWLANELLYQGQATIQ